MNSPKLKVITRKRGTLPKQSVRILRTWLEVNAKNAYPTEAQKIQLAAETRLTMLQVSNWFINARRRILPHLPDAPDPKQMKRRQKQIDPPSPASRLSDNGYGSNSFTDEDADSDEEGKRQNRLKSSHRSADVSRAKRLKTPSPSTSFHNYSYNPYYDLPPTSPESGGRFSVGEHQEDSGDGFSSPVHHEGPNRHSYHLQYSEDPRPSFDRSVANAQLHSNIFFELSQSAGDLKTPLHVLASVACVYRDYNDIPHSVILTG